MMKKALILLIVAQIAQAAPSVKNHVKCATNHCTTAGIDMSGSTLLVACTKNFSAAGTISDSSSNIWAPVADYNDTGNEHVELFYVNNPTVSASQTFTTGTAGYGVYVVGFLGTTTSSPYDQHNGAGAAATTTQQTGSVTPAVDGELLVACLSGTLSDASLTVNNSFTILDHDTFNGAVVYGGGIAWLVQGTAAPINPTWSSWATANTVASIATFQPASGVATPMSGTLPLLGL